MGNDQTFLALVSNYMSLQTLISNSFSPAYTINVHRRKSPSVVTFQYFQWCQHLGDNSCLLSKWYPRCRPPTLQLPGGSAVPWLFSLLDPNSNEEKILRPVWITLNSQVQYAASNILMSPFVSACGSETSNQTHSSWAGSGSHAQGRSQILHFICIALRHFSNLLHLILPGNLIIQEAPSSVVLQLWPVPVFDSSGWSKAQQWKYLWRKWSPSSFLPQYYPQKMNFTAKTPTLK